MALITDYASLQDALEAFQDRSDVPLDQAIQLAEARLNRVLTTVESDASLTGVAGSREVDITALGAVNPISLFLLSGNAPVERQPVMRPAGTFTYSTVSAMPTMWARDDNYIKFDCPLDQAYSIRFRYVGKIGLSDTVTTNSLLTDYPDVYLAAALLWGGLFTNDQGNTSRWASVLEVFMNEHSKVKERNQRGQLTVDPAIGTLGRGGWGYRAW